MIRINLLSEGRRPAVARRSKTKNPLSGIEPSLALLVGGVVLGVLLAAGWWLLTTSARNGVQEKVDVARAEVKLLEPILKEVADFKEKKEELTTKIQVIQDLRNAQSGPVSLMDEISRSLPEQVWLDAMSVRGRKVNLRGRAFNTNAIASFIENLQSVPWFREPEPKNIQQADGNTYAFDIDFDFEVAPPPAEDGEGEEGAAEGGELDDVAAAS